MAKEIRKETDWLGNEKEVIYDGNSRVGEIRTEKTFSGDEVKREYDSGGHFVSETRHEQTFLGASVERTYTPEGQRIGETRHERTFLGDPVDRTYNTKNDLVSETRRENTFFGTPLKRVYSKGGPRTSTESQADLEGSGSYDSGYVGSSVVPRARRAGSNAKKKPSLRGLWLFLGFGIVALVAMKIAVEFWERFTSQGRAVAVSRTLEHAQAAIPIELGRIYSALDKGRPSEVVGVIAPDILNSEQGIDYLCQPFTHRAHYTLSVIQRPGGVFIARVRVLFKPFMERAYLLSFRTIGDHYVLFKAESDPLMIEIEAARETVRQFIFAVRAGKWDIAAQYASQHLPLDELQSDPEWQQYFTKITEVSTNHVYDVSLENGHSITFNVQATVSTFEFPEFRVDAASGKIVGAFFKNSWMNLSRLPHEGHGVIDRHLDRDTLVRFGLESAPEWSREAKLDIGPFRSLDDLKWPSIPAYLWVTDVQRFEDRTVVQLAAACVNEEDSGALLSPAKQLERAHGIIPVPDKEAGYRDAYITDQSGHLYELVSASLDFKSWPGTWWFYHEIRPHEKLRFKLEFQAVPKETTALHLYYRQFGTVDIPL